MDELFDGDHIEQKPRVITIKSDFLDSLHGNVTVLFLFIILILVTVRQSVHEPIKCWYLTSFEQDDYIHQFCWINSTYHYFNESDTKRFTADRKAYISYYQFIPFILLGQIVMFYIPSIIWKNLTSNSKGYMNTLLDIASSDPEEDDDEKQQELLKSFNSLRPVNLRNNNQSIKSRNSNQTKLPLSTTDDDNFKSEIKPLTSISVEKVILIENSSKVKPKSRKERVVAALKPLSGVQGICAKYFLFKFLHLTNVIGQMFLLHYIFNGGFLDFGYKYIINLWNTQNPINLTKQFPLFTLCDFYYYVPNRQIHDNSIQCILPINILVEKFYVLIWFWLVFISIITFFNFFSWLYEILCISNASFLTKYLKIYAQIKKGENEADSIDSDNSLTYNYIPNENDIRSFQDYLGRDGLVMLFLMKSAGGDVTFIRILGLLWKNFKTNS